jgi:hypothetical protein
MADMFYSKEQTLEKLNITEDQLQELVEKEKLRIFRTGDKVHFKVDEVEALMSEANGAEAEETPAPPEPQAGADEISLAPERIGDTASDQLMEADTVAAGEGINVLGETDSEAQPVDDLLAETKGTADEESLEEIEEDVNLDTFGSGSGLLDLSLQADDTSLGGILDEIYTSESGQETAEGPALEVAAEAAPIIPEDEELATPGAIAEMPVMAAAIGQPELDSVSNALGIMLFLPLLAVVYTIIVAVAGLNDVMPGFLKMLQGIDGPYGVHVIWYAMGGAMVFCGLIVGGAAMMGGGGGGGKTPKKEKVKKPKKPKEPKKPKKPKKAKGKK